MLGNVTHSLFAHRLLDRFEDRGHLVNWPPGADNYVSVLAHKNKGPESEVEGPTALVDRVSQAPARRSADRNRKRR